MTAIFRIRTILAFEDREQALQKVKAIIEDINLFVHLGKTQV